MTKEEATAKALDFIRTAALEVGPLVDARYLDLKVLDEMGKTCPPDLVETYQSVRSKWRNQWVLNFKRKNEIPGQVCSPETIGLCVFDSGEVATF